MKLPLPVRIVLMPFRLIALPFAAIICICCQMAGEEDAGDSVLDFVIEAGNQ
jgi:hypothetical protein